MYHESKTRTLIKTITWRLSATFVTVALVYLFIKEIKVATAVGLIELVTKMILYYIHERAWDRIPRGKQKEVEGE